MSTEELYKKILGNSSMGFLVLDKGFNEAVYYNKAALEALDINASNNNLRPQKEIALRLVKLITENINSSQHFPFNQDVPPTEAVSYFLSQEQNHHIEICIEPFQSADQTLYFVLLKLIPDFSSNGKAVPGSFELNPAVASFLELSQETIWVVDTAHQLLLFNPKFSTWFERAVGRKPSEGELMTDVDFTQQGNKKWKKLYERALKEQQFEVHDMLGNRYFKFTLSHFADGQGNTIGVVVFGKDVTKEQQNQSALLDSESRFRALAGSIPGVVFIVEKEKEYGVVYLSDNVQNITGYAPADFYKHKINLGDLIHPGDVGWILQYQEESYQKGQPYHIEYRMKNGMGEYRWIEEYGAVITKNDGRKYLQGVFFDITERKQAEKAITQSERNFRLIFDNTSEIIFSLDTDWQFTYASPAAYKFIGFEPAEMVGEEFLPFVHEDDRESVRDALNFLLVSKSPKQNIKYRVRHKEGGSRWHLGAFNPVFSQSDQILNIVGTSKDITESVYAEAAIKEQNQKLKELNEEKDLLLSVVAHDLKSPLDKVKGLGQLVTMAGGLNEEQENYLRLIENLTESGANLIATLLDLSKLEQDLTKINIKEEDVTKLLEYVVDSHSQRAKEKKIELDLEVPGYYMGAFLDASLVTSCIDNLISNAIKFSTSFTKVTVKLEREKADYFSVKVIDEGPGITPEDRQKMFQKFQKLSAQPTNGESSSGLGLAIVKALVDKMKGNIRVESEVNQGTTFTIELPFQGDTLEQSERNAQ